MPLAISVMITVIALINFSAGRYAYSRLSICGQRDADDASLPARYVAFQGVPAIFSRPAIGQAAMWDYQHFAAISAEFTLMIFRAGAADAARSRRCYARR